MKPRWLLVPIIAFALVIGGGCFTEPHVTDEPSSVPMPGLPELPPAAPERGPLYGVVYTDSETGELARLDPRTLLPVRGVPRLDMTAPATTSGVTEYVMAISPDRSFAIAGNDGEALTLIDLRAMRRVGTLRAGQPVGQSLAATWSSPDRLLLVGKHGEKLVATIVDLAARRVLPQRVHQVPVGQLPISAEPVSGGVVVRLQPTDGIATAGLGYVAGDGSVRWAALDRIRAGNRFLEQASADSDVPAGQRIEPGLAVDMAGNRVFVVSAGSPVAEVSLPTLDVTYHRLTVPGRDEPGALLSWLGTGFSAQLAEAKVVAGPVRQAAWLGNRFLAVWGEDVSVETKDSGPVSRSRAYGVRLIDTRSWTIQTLAPDASQATLAGNRFLAYGGSDGSAASDGEGNRPGLDFAGLRIFAPGGGKPVSVLEGRHLSWVETYGTYAYAPLERPETPELENGFAIVDLRTGEVIGKQRQEIPLLLS